MGFRVFTAVVAGALLAILVACGLESPTFEPTTGSIHVVSIPDSASIILNGSPTGLVTPATLTLLPLGDHRVRVGKAGFAATLDSMTVVVSAGETALAEFTLVRTSGNLTVTSTPGGASIFIDGADCGACTPADLAGLAEGEHVVRVVLPGYTADPESLTVFILPQEIVGADFHLIPMAAPSPKTVLLEGFSNVCCPGCPEMNQSLHEFMEMAGYGPDRVLLVKYSVGYPSPSDPHYLANPQDNDARAWGPNYDYTGYYAELLTSIPSLFGDGALLGGSGNPPTTAELVSLVDALLGRDPGFGIQVDADVSGASVAATVTLNASGDLDLTGMVLNAVLVQTPIEYEEPPCSGGDELLFHGIMRDFQTVTASLPSLTAGTPVVQTATLTGMLSWPADHLFVIAFVQDPATREVLQAGSNIPPAYSTASPEGIPRSTPSNAYSAGR